MSNACFHTFHRCALNVTNTTLPHVNAYSGSSIFRSLTGQQGCLQPFRESTLWTSAKQQSYLRRHFHSSPAVNASHPSSQRPQRPVKRSPKSTSPEYFRDLSRTDIKNAFGRQLDTAGGSRILRILQSRRVNGSLIEHGVHIEDAGISEDGLNQALRWLRKRYPVDEEAAAEAWADRAAAELEQDYDKRARELGLIKGSEGQGRTAEQDVYSRPGNRSMLDDMRMYNEEKAKKQEEAREKSGEAQRSRDMQLAKTSEAEQQAKERAVALAERRQEQTEEGFVFKGPIPEMALWRRLVPSTLFAICFMGAMAYVAESYKAPTAARRMWSDLPPTIATLTGLGMLMTLITCAWHVPKFWRMMNTYLLSVPALPEPISMFGNIFSHQNFKHLTANLTFMWLYGISLHEDIGRGNFMALFCAGGVGGSITSLYYHVLKGNLSATMSGASGGVAALIFAWMYFNASKPEGPFHASSKLLEVLKFLGFAFAIVQIPLHFGPGVMERIDVLSHFGGAVVGLVGAYALKARIDWKRQQQMSNKHTIIKTPT